MVKVESREKRARRLAAKDGYMLRKSRRDGGWMVIDLDTNGVAWGWPNYPGDGGTTLESVEAWLADEVPA